MKDPVAVIGLGNMGLPMARNLLAAGFPLTVHNRTRARAEPLAAHGASVAASPAEAAERARIVITMLADDQAVDAVVFGERGLLAGLKPGAIHVGMSTVEPATSRRLAVAHRGQGSEYLAAPVFGRPEVAEQAKLFVIAAGPAEAVDAALPVLQALSRGVARVGDDASRANLVKLAGNFLLVAMLEALAEALALVEKAGLDRLAVLQTLNGALFASPLYQANGERMSRAAFSPAGFPLALGLKDVRLVLRTADQLGVPMPVAGLAHDHFLSATSRGHGDLDWTAVSEVVREAAGLAPAWSAPHQGPGNVR
jgi:3-hydroxyisobutyrate dehydrogenase-like beta-hydroxyacid dehydrogenase